MSDYIEFNEVLNNNDGLFFGYILENLTTDELKIIAKDADYLEAAKKTFDVTNYADREDAADEVRLLALATKKPAEYRRQISELFDAESILRESIKRDEGKNLTRYLQQCLQLQDYFDPSDVEYLAQHEFAAKILAENPDIAEGAKKSFNVCNYDMSGTDNRLNISVSGERENKYTERLLKVLDRIGNDNVFKSYFDPYEVMKESQNMSDDDKWARAWAAKGHRMSLEEIEKNLEQINKVLPNHPELLPLVAKSLDIKRSDYNRNWHYDKDFEEGKARARKLLESGKLPYECYVESKKNDKYEYAEFKDKEEIIEAYLKQKDLNIFQLENCLNINSYVTENLIRQNPEIRERVEKLFENPKNYVVQKRFQDSETLNKFFDVEKKLDIAEQNLRKLSGNEVFDILTKPESSYPEAIEAQKQLKIIQRYFKQTRDLNEYSPDADLCYSSFRKDERWNDLNPLLDVVGTFKCAPEVAEAIEERLARIFAHHNYKGVSRAKASYSYISEAGMARFAAKMVEALGENPDSAESAFYLKHSQYVLDQWDQYNHSYTKMASQALPQLAEKGRFDIYEKIVTDMSTAEGKYADRTVRWSQGNMRDELIKDVASPASKFYISKVKEFFKDANVIADITAAFVQADKGKHLPETESLCQSLFEIYKQSGCKHKELFEDSLMKIYQYHKDLKIAEVLIDNAQKRDVKEDELLDCYEKWQRTGLKCYEDLTDKILAKAESLKLRDFPKDIDYAPLHQKLKTSKVKDIDIYPRDLSVEQMQTLLRDNNNLETLLFTGAFSVTPELVTPNPKLRKITCHKDVKIENLPEILARLPEIREIGGYYDPIILPEEERDNLYQYLKQAKPETLENLKFVVSREQAKELMQKYPTFTIESYGYDDEVYNLKRRNRTIREVKNGEIQLTGKGTSQSDLGRVLGRECLVESLQVLPSEKRPTLRALKETEPLLYKKINDAYKENYSATITKIADILGEKELKQAMTLYEVAEKGEVLKYLKSLPESERPKVSILASEHKALLNTKLDKHIQKRISGDKEDKKLELQNIIREMKPTTEELQQLLLNDKCSDNLKDALRVVYTEQQVAARTATARAKFEQWQAEQKGKGSK